MDRVSGFHHLTLSTRDAPDDFCRSMHGRSPRAALSEIARSVKGGGAPDTPAGAIGATRVFAPRFEPRRAASRDGLKPAAIT